MDFKQHVIETNHNLDHTLDLVTSYGFSIDILFVIDLALLHHG